MSGIQKRTIWRTTDGKDHESERSALLWQTENDLWDLIRINTDGRDLFTQKCMADWIVENSDVLAPLLITLESARKMDR